MKPREIEHSRIEPTPARAADTAVPETAPPRARPPFFRAAIIVVGLVLGGLVTGFIPRWHARNVSLADSKELAVPTVGVVAPAPGRATDGLMLSAEIKPLLEASIYARANGYLKGWFVDIGSHVEAGQTLAEIDTPELEDQLDQARAQLAESEAAMALAKTTAERWAALLETASVSDQENAEKMADYKLKSATVEAQHANVHRLEELQAFQHVVAPFAGTITSRNTDIGDLIVAGSGRELFHLAQTHTLRVFVHVPQSAARGVAVGQTAEVTIPEIPGRTFPAKVVATSGAMSSVSRTLLTELRVDNPHDEILANSYAQVHFTDPNPNVALTLPSSALLFRANGLQVAVVQPGDSIQLKTVSVGRDFGKTVEILSGVTPADRVVASPNDALVDGLHVRVAASPESLASK